MPFNEHLYTLTDIFYMAGDKTEVNYLYFSFFFLFLFALTFSHFIHASQPLWGAPLFFLLYASAQALLEVFCLILVGILLHRWLPKWTFRFYVAISFVFLMAHFANFTIVRLMDVTLSYCIKVFLGRGFEHFFITCRATNVNPTMSAVIIAALVLMPLIGIAFYWWTHKLSRKKPLHFSPWTVFGAIAIVSGILLSLDLIARPFLSLDLHYKYKKTLPLGATFLSPDPRLMPLSAPLRTPRKERDMHELLGHEIFVAKERPNIYLFVIETLRRDCIDSQIAPHMTNFAKQNIEPPLTYANANFTYLSWFSLFHSCYPFYWTYVRDHWKEGSIPLNILKKMGYQIRIFSSADLNYFTMDRIIFGKDRQLIDEIREYFPLHIEPWERDSLAIKELIEETKRHPNGTLFTIFLDSTHSEYSSPEEQRPFQPAATSLDYLGITRSERDLQLLKNRYKNSVHWVDHLLGKTLEHLKEIGQYDDAIIVVTGDHGEEFFEEGSLFHGTHLNDWQTRVPLLYKFPGVHNSSASLSTHLDLFPSILHYLTGREDFSELFDGQSIFMPNRGQFAFTMQHNGVDIPYEFRITDGEMQLIGRFLNPPSIYSIPGVELFSLKACNDELLNIAFEALLKKEVSQQERLPSKI